jgi:hypothetical protein
MSNQIPEVRPRGICPACDRTLALTKTGNMRYHNIGPRYPAPYCPGSGQPAKGVTATLPDTRAHCHSCTCPPRNSDELIIQDRDETDGACETCGEVRWLSFLYTSHRGDPKAATHCGCCTHLHDLKPGAYVIPTRISTAEQEGSGDE